MEDKRQERRVKVLQYIMLAALFGLALVLPAYGARQQIRESAGDEVVQTKDSESSTEKGTEAGQGTIVLDAGHGGFDPGMKGESGVEEKSLNLTYAKKLEALLEARGYRVVQTRDTDSGLYDENAANKKAQDMQKRCAIIEAEAPLLTVSIHQNSYPEDSSVCGPQVFYYGQSEEGRKLAECIQSCMNEQLAPARPRSVKGNETYYILKRSAGTTVIVECGFLTNPQEEAMLQDEAYQDRVVQAVCDGIVAYLTPPEKSADSALQSDTASQIPSV